MATLGKRKEEVAISWAPVISLTSYQCHSLYSHTVRCSLTSLSRLSALRHIFWELKSETKLLYHLLSIVDSISGGLDEDVANVLGDDLDAAHRAERG